jgi:hypothetical protein
MMSLLEKAITIGGIGLMIFCLFLIIIIIWRTPSS